VAGGVFERDLLRLVPDAQVLAMDFSPGAIHLAKQRAAEAGLQIEYRVEDLNEVKIEPHTFDVVSLPALYTISRRWSACSSRSAILLLLGVIDCKRICGPNQLQWTDKQVRVINEVMGLLPDRYRRRISNPLEYKRDFPGPSPLEEMNRLDPTEAVHAKKSFRSSARCFISSNSSPSAGRSSKCCFRILSETSFRGRCR